MTRTREKLSVAELEQLLRDRKAKLAALVRRRSQLQRELEQIDKEIQLLEGRTAAGTTPTRSGKRPRNERTLAEVVLDVLQSHKGGLTLSGLAERVFATGYQSSSTNFNNVLYQCLYNSDQIAHDADTGKYRLK